MWVKCWAGAAALLILLLSLKCPDLRSRYSNVFESQSCVPFAACTPPLPMPESSQADSRHKNGDQSPDVKSYQVQYYHQTYIIKIMDITAYFLSLLSDWLEPGLPLVGFFGGRLWIANRGLSTGIHTGLGHIQRDNGSDSVPIVALPLPDRTRAIHICPFVSWYLSAIRSCISRVLWTADCKYQRVLFSPVVRMLLSFITTIITSLT